MVIIPLSEVSPPTSSLDIGQKVKCRFCTTFANIQRILKGKFFLRCVTLIFPLLL